MPEETRTIRSVDWRGVFPFLHLFRAFRVAMHPSKLLLALGFLVLVYGLGRGMDWVWPTKFSYSAQSAELYQLPTMYNSVPGYDRSGPFDVLVKWQLTRLQDVAGAVLRGSPAELVEAVVGFVYVGPSWGFRMHPLFSVVFGSFVLVMWSLFGGAIARVAAVHVARDEKISMRSALRFSSGKLLSFFFAPVILGLFIGFLGLLIAVTNTLYYVPFVGPIVVGAIFVLTLLVGIVMTLALFGTLGGSGLMYPTIAVEGSDSFDAISRSFSYFFARPWRLAFYALVALVYGVVTFLVLRLFILATFLIVRQFQVWFLNEPALDRFDLFFPMPREESLWATTEISRLAGTSGGGAAAVGEKIGAGLIGFWYHALVSLLGAYAVSFYFSSSTIIYYLLRREVDATELDDVYLEEGEEDDLGDIGLAPGSDPNAVASADGGGSAAPSPATKENSPGGASASATEDPSADDGKSREQPATFSSPPPM